MLQTGTAYTKPFGESIFAKQTVTNYAYPREELIREPIFPYFVLDGGAFNFANDRFGTVNGDDILSLTCSGTLFKEFRHGDPYQWERSFAYTADTGFKKKYEWQIWPQRLYMTLPLAHAFLRTGDRQYAKKWLETVKGWDAAHPYQPFDPAVHYITTDMVWRDMQVAWRTLSLLHGAFMLQEAPFSREDWQYIYRFIERHAQHLYEEAQDRLSRALAQNHVLQIGVALIMAGTLFPEFENSADYIRAGSETVEMNLRGAIYADGGSNEDSPSYSHFIVRLYLEAYLLLKNNGCKPIEGLQESIGRQYEWLYQFSAPTGRVLRLSDSYAMDGLADLQRAERLIQLDFPRVRRNTYFPDSGAAILRCGDLTLAVDAMSYNPGHQHLGRPQILLFFRDDPVLIDAGCCNYDRWELYLALRSPEYHNIVYSPDLMDHPDTGEKMQLDVSLHEYDVENSRIVLACRVRAGESEYTWQRTLQLGNDRLIIADRAESAETIRWRSSLFFARQDSQLSPDGKTFRQLTERWLLTASFAQPVRQELVPVMDEDNRINYAVVTRTETKGKAFENHMELVFRER